MTDWHVGDRPWWAIYRLHDEVRVACPVCYGKRVVTLILGNDDRVELPCDYCGKGYDPPTGYVIERQLVARAEQVTITTVHVQETAGGVVRDYIGPDGWCCPAAEDLFTTEAEANVRATEKAEAAMLEESTQAERIKANKLKSFTWNAGYHMREAKRLRKQIEYHERNAVLCKARAKTGEGE